MKPITTFSPLSSRKNCESGFTLIEMMIVLVILGIMSVFSLHYVQGQREKANLKIATTMLTSYAQELTAFKLKSGILPENDREFAKFKEQLYFDPNQDPRQGAYFQVVPRMSEHSLITVPQKKHPFKSYAKMNLPDFSISICRPQKKAPDAAGDDCQPLIGTNRVGQ